MAEEDLTSIGRKSRVSNNGDCKAFDAWHGGMIVAGI